MRKNILIISILLMQISLHAQWSQITSPYAGNLWNITFINSTLGFSGGNTAILTTNDGGISWTSANTGSVFSINDISFGSYDTGYYAANNSIVGKTIDHGQNWTTIDPGVSPWAITAIHFISATTGFIGNSGGEILKTINGGTSWTQQTPSLSLSDPKKIHFFDPQNGILCAEDGKIRRTINGGSNWSVVSTLTSNNLYDMYFANSTTGYVCGANGMILKSVNSGSTWSALTSGTTQWLYTICFKDPLDGYAGGANGTLLHTTDGGANWSPVTSSVPQAINDIGYNNGRYIGVCDQGKIITDLSTDIETIYSKVQSTVYPNPSSGHAFIKLDKLYKDAALTVYDLNGKKVIQKNYLNKSTLNIDSYILESGLYLYEVILDENRVSRGIFIVE